jgi:two-component system OmpR family response regulator
MEYSPYNIFIIDDDEIYLKSIEESLNKRKNTRIKKFVVGEMCLQHLHQKPDLIILDHHLDTKYIDASNGLDLMKKIKKTRPETNFIMLSGQDDLEIAIFSIQSGAFDYIVKNKSAFVRLNYSIDKLLKSRQEKVELNLYKKATILISILFAIVVISILVLVKLFPNIFNG